jgi:hypothetical protein
MLDCVAQAFTAAIPWSRHRPPDFGALVCSDAEQH